MIEHELIKKIEDKSAVIGIVGLGYVGLPLALRFAETGFYVIGFDLDSVELTPEVLQQADCVLIATNHDDFDYEMIKANAKIIVDTRGVYREPADHIVRA